MLGIIFCTHNVTFLGAATVATARYILAVGPVWRDLLPNGLHVLPDRARALHLTDFAVRG